MAMGVRQWPLRSSAGRPDRNVREGDQDRRAAPLRPLTGCVVRDSCSQEMEAQVMATARRKEAARKNLGKARSAQRRRAHGARSSRRSAGMTTAERTGSTTGSSRSQAAQGAPDGRAARAQRDRSVPPSRGCQRRRAGAGLEADRRGCHEARCHRLGAELARAALVAPETHSRQWGRNRASRAGAASPTRARLWPLSRSRPPLSQSMRQREVV
jgi:hypothetical protein